MQSKTILKKSPVDRQQVDSSYKLNAIHTGLLRINQRLRIKMKFYNSLI